MNDNYEKVDKLMSEKDERIQDLLNIMLCLAFGAIFILLILVPLRGPKMMLFANLSWFITIVPLAFTIAIIQK